MMEAIAILGHPGAGKTWTISHLIDFLVGSGYNHYQRKIGLVEYHDFSGLVIMGKYDGSKFQGTDRLSMAVSVDFDRFFAKMQENGVKYIVAEGDRINNMTFFQTAMKYGTFERIKCDPGNYEKLLRQRMQREHVFAPSFLKSIASKVDKHTFDKVMDSDALLAYLANKVRS